MKKIYSFALLAAATLSVLSSCKKESFLSEEEVAGDGPVSFVAYLDEEATKTTIDGLKIKWNEGDEVSVNGKIYVAAPDAEDATKALFTLKTGQTAPTGTTFRAYYPTSAYVSGTNTASRYKLQGTQTYNGDDVSSINYMYAQTEEFNESAELHFKNVCGLLKLQLKGPEKVKQIKVTAPTSNYLYGTLSNFAYSSAGVISYSSFTSSGRGTSVYLDCGNGVQLDEEEATDFYIALPEKSYSKLTIVVSTDGGDKTFASTKACPVVKNKVFTLPEMTVSFPVLEFNAELSIDKCEATSPSAVDLEVSIKPEDKTVYYMPAVESKGYVSQYADGLALAKADVEYWKSQGATSLQSLINAGLAVKGDQLKDASYNYCTPDTDYVLYAFAIDADFNVSPAVMLPFHTPEFVFPVSAANYEDYLGQWIMGDDLLTVTQKVAGSTYNVSGIKNQNNPSYNYNVEAVEASYEDGYIVLKEQKTDATTSVGSYGTCDVYLSGVFSQSGKTYGYYPINAGTNAPQEIFRGALKDDKITVYAGSCQYGAFESMGFSWVIQSGTNKGLGNTFAGTTLGNMTKYEEPTGPTPEGDWFCASVVDQWGDTYEDWTMNIVADGIGFKINNFDQGFDAFLESQVAGLRSLPPVGVWNSTAKTLTIANNSDTGIAAGGVALYFMGLDTVASTTCDIVLEFDFDNNTCQFKNHYGAYLADEEEPGWYSLYPGGQVFSKVAAASSVKPMNYGGKISFKSSCVKHTSFDKNISRKVNAQIAVMPELKADMKMTRVAL